MYKVINTEEIDDNVSICIEYQIPLRRNRIDFIVAGRNENGEENVVIIELKQWSQDNVWPLADEGIVSVKMGGYEYCEKHPHPSYQAWSYAMTLKAYNEYIQTHNVLLFPCAYMHNYSPYEKDKILDSSIYKEINEAPLFVRDNGEERLREFIVSKVSKDDKVINNKGIMERIDGSRNMPSKSLQDAVLDMLRKREENNEFILIESQKVIFGEIMSTVYKLRNGCEKKVFIVSGGPGTGKSVLAIHLLCKILNDGKSCAYVSKNSAPRNVYKAKLAEGNFKNSCIDSLFMGSGSFISSALDEFDVLIVDEAHRLNRKSGFHSSKGENQIKEIINAAKISVFFIDEDQIVTAKDIGNIKDIKSFAKNFDAKVIEHKLETQFRCNGSNGYLDFLDDLLEIRKPYYTFDPGEYDVVVYDDLCKMFEDIKRKNLIDNKARMLAGYCWNWVSQKDHNAGPDIVIEDQNFSAYWNFSNTSTWAIDDDTVDQVGCIHTSQGLEFSYVGVIIGDDLRYENGHVITDPSKRARTDASLKGMKEKGREAEKKKDKIIRDTYKTLLSRAMKGCYIYCTDKALAEHIKQKLASTQRLYDDFMEASGYSFAAEKQ